LLRILFVGIKSPFFFARELLSLFHKRESNTQLSQCRIGSHTPTNLRKVIKECLLNIKVGQAVSSPCVILYSMHCTMLLTTLTDASSVMTSDIDNPASDSDGGDSLFGPDPVAQRAVPDQETVSLQCFISPKSHCPNTRCSFFPFLLCLCRPHHHPVNTKLFSRTASKRRIPGSKAPVVMWPVGPFIQHGWGAGQVSAEREHFSQDTSQYSSPPLSSYWHYKPGKSDRLLRHGPPTLGWLAVPRANSLRPLGDSRAVL